MLSDRFVEAVHATDPDALTATLAEDVRFFSPVVFRAYEGREVVGVILTEGAMKVFEDFSYEHRLAGEGRTEALIFKAKVGEREVDGLDLLTFDDEGLVSELKVMVRPMSGLQTLAAAMSARFEALGVGQPSG